MAEETTTVTPRQMGSHLRAVRRRKGLSLSEVARGAGLNRRELVNYERGKAAIPESDLWVLAGSIGVDISELMPPAPSADPEVPAESTNLPALRSTQPAESIGDAVAMLRRGTEEHETSPHLGTLRMLEQLPEGKRVPLKDKQLAELAHDLGENPATIESNVAAILGCDAQTAARIRAMLLAAPHQGHGRRGRRAKAIAAAEAEPATRYQAPVVPPPAATEPAPTEHAAVDVFEELARLPEPLPLPEETALPDIIATPPAPEGAVELVDHDTFPSLGERFGFKQPAMAESTAATTAATAASAGAALHSGADAPPIDVTMRDGWTWSDTNADEPLTRRPVGSDTWTPEPASGHDGNGFDAGWEPPAADDGTVPPSFWEGTDDWSPEAHQPQQYDDTQVAEVAEAADTAEAPGASADPNALWSFEPAAVDPWIAGGWPENPNDMTVPAEHAEYAEPVAPVASVAPAFPGELATGELVDSEWPSTAFTPVGDSTADPVDVWGDAGGTESSFGGFGGFGPYGDDADTPATPVAEYTTDDAPAPWAHTLDPAAADSGFVVDWGEADDAEPDAPAVPVAGQWAGAGTWDEPATPAWEVQTTAPAETDDVPVDAAPGTFDAYDVFAADPFAAATDTTDTGITADAAEVVDDPAAFSFGSDLAATLAATYLPDGTDTTAAFEPEPFVAEPEPFVVEPEPFAVEAAVVEAEPEPETTPETTPETFAPAFEAIEAYAPEPEPEPEAAPVAPAPVAELPRIVWRADASGNVDVAADPEPAAAPAAEVFVTAGPDWQLGNAVPLVEVKSEGALVMRRADERWALADVTAAADFVLEVDVDFRSGPGLGVLFRASVDEHGRMSGYSFDIDPIYDGGGFLVRQWQDDRELWNPIARVAADDPNTMYGKLTVRLEVHGETLTAFVNDAEVMCVDDLAQASVERDRDAAHGERVGVQAWSSSDLVIDTLRVANR